MKDGLMNRVRVKVLRNAIISCIFIALGGVPFSQSKVVTLPAIPDTISWGYYDAARAPVLRIKSGDIVKIETLSTPPSLLREAGLKEEDIPLALIEVDQKVTDRGPGAHLLTGPIWVEEAEPGDTLQIEILSIRLNAPFAFNAFVPGQGLLPGEYPYQKLRVIPLDLERKVALFTDEIEIPLRPFWGSIGVAPPSFSGRISSGPPWIHGGNMDNKELTEGSTLYLAVHVPGALLSLGDGHAAQGNGEVDLTALETALSGHIRVTVRKDLRMVKWPRAETATHYLTMGFHENLEEATKIAVREMIDFLVKDKGLDRDTAYMLCSIAVDLEITQVVDGRQGAHCMLPKAIFIPASPSSVERRLAR